MTTTDTTENKRPAPKIRKTPRTLGELIDALEAGVLHLRKERDKLRKKPRRSTRSTQPPPPPDAEPKPEKEPQPKKDPKPEKEPKAPRPRTRPALGRTLGQMRKPVS